MLDFKKWLFEYIESIDSEFSIKDEDKKLSVNLFNSGKLDSMGLMNLLLDIEENFEFKFDAESFQDRRLQTVSGLIEIVTERINDI